MKLRTGCCPALLIAAAMLIGPVSVAPAAQEGAHISYAQIPPDAFSVVAQVRAKPGKEDELLAATLPLIDLVRSEPQNLVYFLQEDRSAPGYFTFYLVYPSEADFDAHVAMPYVKAWFEKLPDLAEGGVQVTKMRVLQPAH